MTKRINLLFLFLLFIFLDSTLAQDQNNEEIEEVVVVGSRLSNKNVNNILPVTYIDSETISLLGVDSGDELIRSIVQQGTNRFNDAGMPLLVLIVQGGILVLTISEIWVQVIRLYC